MQPTRPAPISGVPPSRPAPAEGYRPGCTTSGRKLGETAGDARSVCGGFSLDGGGGRRPGNRRTSAAGWLHQARGIDAEWPRQRLLARFTKARSGEAGCGLLEWPLNLVVLVQHALREYGFDHIGKID